MGECSKAWHAGCMPIAARPEIKRILGIVPDLLYFEGSVKIRQNRISLFEFMISQYYKIIF